VLLTSAHFNYFNNCWEEWLIEKRNFPHFSIFSCGCNQHKSLHQIIQDTKQIKKSVK
jgi:hypothetical protein